MFGFQSFSDDGLLQFDSEIPQLGLIDKGVVNFTTGPKPYDMLYYAEQEFTFTGTKTPMLALHSTTFAISLWEIRLDSEGKATYFIRVAGTEPKAQNGTFEWFYFDSVTIRNPGAYGLQTFTEDGRLSFDSSKFPAVIRGVDRITPDQYSYVKYGMDIPAGRKYAFVTSLHMCRANGNPGGIDIPPFGVGYVLTKPGTKMTYHEIWDYAWPFAGVIEQKGEYLILDVTNF